MKVVQVYAPTSSHDDEEIEQFYEDVELAPKKVRTQYTVVMGNFNAKVGKKQAGEQAIGNYGIDARTSHILSLQMLSLLEGEGPRKSCHVGEDHSK